MSSLALRRTGPATIRTTLLALVASLVLGAAGVAQAATALQVAAGFDHTCVRTDTGDLRCWGEVAVGDGSFAARLLPADVPELAGITAFADAGDQHSCAVTTMGGVSCWGLNTYGQLGDGTQTQRFSPVGVVGLGAA